MASAYFGAKPLVMRRLLMRWASVAAAKALKSEKDEYELAKRKLQIMDSAISMYLAFAPSLIMCFDLVVSPNTIWKSTLPIIIIIRRGIHV